MDNYSKFLDFKIRGNMNGIRYPCLVDIKYDGITVVKVGAFGTYLAEQIHGDGKNGTLYRNDLPKSNMIFDLLEMLNERPYTKVSLRERREKLCDMFSPGCLATSLICDNRQEVDDCFKNAVNNGYEGIVVKNLNETLEGQTWVKMKFEDEIELKISKVEDSRLETLHGNVVVGLGLNVVDVWQVGDIALVRHNGITNGGSLRNPRIVRKLC